MSILRQLCTNILYLAALSFLPRKLRFTCFALIGVLLGLLLIVAKVSRVTSYMSNSPEACVNCHVMRTEYASWQHSSHRNVATCNDCHVPHDSKLHALSFKARDGIYHSTIFTLRLEPQVIELSDGAKPVVQSNCLYCHGQVVENVFDDPHQQGDACSHADPQRLCWDCHRDVPHGRARGLSSTSGAMAPQLPPAIKRQTPTIGGRRPTTDQ